MSWLSLFFMFILIFLLFNILNYFSLNLKKKFTNKKNNINNIHFLSWKW